MPSYRRRSQYCLGHPISHLPELIAVAVLGMIFVGLCRAQQPPKNGGKPTFWIVFDMNPEFRVNPALDIETDVYRMDQYGEHAKRLTSDHRSHHPSWSPDGQQIVFLQSAPIQNPKGTYGYETPDAIYSLLVSRNVFRMDISGRNLVRVSSVGPDAQDVAWLPGGKHLAVRISNRRNLQVFIGPPDSSGEKFAREETFEELLKEGHAAGAKWLYWPRLTEFFPPDDNFLPAFYAPWAGDPDAMTPENFRRIHTFDADKAAFAKVMDLTGEPASIPTPAFDTTWSLDGNWVTYSRFSDDGHARLFVAGIRDKELGDPSSITDGTLEAHGPAWSADGSRIAFVGLWKNSSQIFIVNRDGTGLMQLSQNPKLSCKHPSWSPDGKWIVAGCGFTRIGSMPFADLYSFAWHNDVALFEVSKPKQKPMRLTQCNPLANNYYGLFGSESGTPGPGPLVAVGDCRANNPSFAPAQLGVL
jgi:dipeptidyl aminopeptidase/acylaminoacyl peptidase